MSKRDKILEQILRGLSDSNIGFTDLCGLLRSFGFEERIRGGHHIFSREDVAEIINLQPLGAKAKPYQVKQTRALIIKYRLGGKDE
jgi:hypothetical protein